jgi:hypothetical protein
MMVFTGTSCPAVIESSSKPSASSTSVKAGSPAISPHIDTGMRAAFAACTMFFKLRSTARWSGRYRYATSAFCLSMASEYWMRSLVPTEKKSASAARRSAIHAALGVSTMMPTWKRLPTGTPARPSSLRQFSNSLRASRSSDSPEMRGNMMRRLPCTEARSSARSCTRNISRCERQ